MIFLSKQRQKQITKENCHKNINEKVKFSRFIQISKKNKDFTAHEENVLKWFNGYSFVLK